MILREIRLRNVRSYEKGELTLPPGTVALFGEIGSGKSSILQAVDVALFGFAEVEPAHLLRHGCQEGEVEVAFEDGGSLLSLRRTFQRSLSRDGKSYSTSKCTLARDGHRAAYTVTEMKAEVVKLLGFPDDPHPRSPSDLWRWAVYIPQERMRDVLSQNADERLETIRKAHGLEEYRIARENCGELEGELKKIEGVLRGEVRIREEEGKSLGELSSRLKEFEKQLAERRAELDRLHLSLGEAEACWEGLRKLLSEIDLAKERLRGLTNRLTETEGRTLITKKRKMDLVSKITEERVRGKELEVSLAALSLVPNALVEGEQRVQSLKVRREEAQRGREGLLAARERAGFAKRALENSDAQILRLRKELARRAEALGLLEREVGLLPKEAQTSRTLPEIEERLREVGRSLEGVGEGLGASRHTEREVTELIESGTCPRCHQAVDPVTFQAHLSGARERTKALERERETLEGRRKDLEREREVERGLFEWREREKRVRLAREEVVASQRELDKVDSERSLKLMESEAAQGEVSRLEPEEWRYQATLKAEGKAEKDLVDLRKEVDRHRVLEEELRSLKKSTMNKEEELSHLEETLRQSEEERQKVWNERRAAEESMVALENGKGEYASSEERYREVQREVNLRERELAGVERDVENLKESIGNVEEAMRKGREALGRAQACRAVTDWLEFFAAALEEIERRRLEGIHREFAREFTRYFALLVEDESMRAALDDSFTPSVATGGILTPPGALSGGERTALGLAYRLALGHTVRAAQKLRIDSLILDEPTEGFSAGQVTKLSELLRELGHRQILLVSHDTALTGIADHVVRVEKTEGKSVLVGGS